MFDKVKFKEFIQSYDGVGYRDRFIAALADCFPNDILERNILVNCYDLGIKDHFSRAEADQTLLEQFASRLGDTYGLSKEKAMWACNTWMYAIGKDIELVEEKNLLEEYFSEDKHVYCKKDLKITVGEDVFDGIHLNMLKGEMGWTDSTGNTSSRSSIYGYKFRVVGNFDVARHGNIVNLGKNITIEFKNENDAQEFQEIMRIINSKDYSISLPWAEDDFLHDEEYLKNEQATIDNYLSGEFIKDIVTKANVYYVSYDAGNLLKEKIENKVIHIAIRKNDRNGGVFLPGNMGEPIGWEQVADLSKYSSFMRPLYMLVYSDDHKVFFTTAVDDLGTSLHYCDGGKRIAIGDYDDYSMIEFLDSDEGQNAYNLMQLSTNLIAWLHFQHGID